MVYHIRKPESTPLHMVTYCGQEPQVDTWYPSWMEDADREKHQPCSIVLMTDWEFVKSMPDMPSLCRECVKAVNGPKVKINPPKSPTPQDIKQMIADAEEEFDVPF